MKTKHLIIPTYTARHFFAPGSTLLSRPEASVLFPSPNKEGLYWFPDSEVYLRVPHLKEATKVLIVHSGYPHPNRGLIELFMMLDIVSLYAPHAEKNILFTAMPYARQDKAYYDGEINAAETLLKNLTHRYGVNKILTIDAHFAGKAWTKTCPFKNLTAVELLKRVAGDHHGNMVVMAPDAGSARRAHIKGAKKQRKNSYEVDVNLGEDFAAAVEGKVVAVVDDLLSTGATLEQFHAEAKKYGARKILALITHGVNQSGIDRTLARYDGLFLTNSIKRAEANVSVIPLIEQAIEEVFT
jgi:ribose-phosphate pyrophosphokinase